MSVLKEAVNLQGDEMAITNPQAYISMAWALHALAFLASLQSY